MKKDEKEQQDSTSTTTSSTSGQASRCYEDRNSVIVQDSNHKQHEELHEDPTTNGTIQNQCSEQQQLHAAEEEGEEECKNVRRQSIKTCLFDIHDHCVEFLEQSKNKQQQTNPHQKTTISMIAATSSSEHQTRDHINKFSDDDDSKNNKVEQQIDYTDTFKNKQCQHQRIEESPTYEEWIKELHPENVRRTKKSSTITTSSTRAPIRPTNQTSESSTHLLLDHRFYVRDSDHRIIWNSYCDMYGYSERKIDQHDHDNNHADMVS